MAGRIAYVGIDRQVHVIGPDGRNSQQLTWAKVPSELSRWGGSRGRDSHAWPCWSPDGAWVSCFQSEESDDVVGNFRVCSVQVDGVEERQLVALTHQFPIYAQWSPDGNQLAVLTQDADQLQLLLCNQGQLGHSRLIEEGVPLFFSWASDSRRVLVHAGSQTSRRGRLLLRCVDSTGEDVSLSSNPGSFCTPLFVGDRILYVTAAQSGSNVCMSNLDGQSETILMSLHGLLAVIPSSDGKYVAVGSAPGGEGTPYQGIWIVPSIGGPPVRVTEETCQAFFWVPGCERMVLVCRAERSNALQWKILDIESKIIQDIGTFWPSRDQLFYLHFFEQYSNSHPIVSVDGRMLVFAGHPDPLYGGDSRSRLWGVDLTVCTPRATELAEGTFGVFSKS